MTVITPGHFPDPGQTERDPEPRTDRRHPVELTVARLTDHVDQHGRHLTPSDIDTLADAVEVLDQLRVRLDRAARRRGES